MTAQRWLRGNTHTHTLYSDGDSPPEVVVDWYATHGYDFLFLTDHNVLIPEPHLARLARRGIVVFQGEEITMASVHVNGLGLQQPIVPPEPAKFFAEAYVSRSRSERVRWALAEVEAQGGVLTVNHPLSRAALDAEALLEVEGLGLVEIANMHPGMEAMGGTLAAERLWDRLLSAGRPILGVAADDAHHFATFGPLLANPGRGWVMVEAEQPTLDGCLDALRSGRFYSSTGLALGAYWASHREIALELADGEALFELIGAEGRVLDAVDGPSATFDLGHGSPYARVRATDLNGRMLWTQPVFR